MDFQSLMLIGLFCEIIGAILIALPILRHSKWNLDYLKDLKENDEETLEQLNQGVDVSNFELAKKMVEDELKFISRIENDERNKKYDKIQTFFGLVLLIGGFILQTYVVLNTL